MTNLWIARSALQTIQAEADRHAPATESGGLVLGYWPSLHEAVITHATTPGPGAQRKRHGYRPDHEYDLAQIERIWRETSRASTYLGDWHSHPESSTRLSLKDRKTVRRIAETPEAGTIQPIMLLVVLSAGNWAVTPWRGHVVRIGPISWLACDRVGVAVFD